MFSKLTCEFLNFYDWIRMRRNWSMLNKIIKMAIGITIENHRLFELVNYFKPLFQHVECSKLIPEHLKLIAGCAFTGFRTNNKYCLICVHTSDGKIWRSGKPTIIINRHWNKELILNGRNWFFEQRQSTIEILADWNIEIEIN